MNEGIKKFEELLRTDESFQAKLTEAAALAPVVPAVMAGE